MKEIKLRQELIPESLKKARRQNKSWGEFSRSADGDTLRQLKAKEQGGLCGYCECSIDEIQPGETHIDHFHRKGEHPGLTYEWSNLVLSCTSKNSCGFYKDNKGRCCTDDLINPHIENPRELLTFIPDSSKTCRMRVIPRPSLSTTEREKAVKTIEAFHLNCDRLVYSRYSAWLEYKDAIKELAYCDDSAEVRDMISFYLEEMETREYPSTLVSCTKDCIKGGIVDSPES